jgi:5-methylcytosine-specific restriction enzyme B
VDKILAAIARFDKELRADSHWANWENNQAHQFAIRNENKLYPVKQIISMATSTPVSSFSGGNEANNYLKERGFNVESLRSPMQAENTTPKNADNHPRLRQELKAALDRGFASGELITQRLIAEHTSRFRDRFGPESLSKLDDEELLQLMHGRQESDSKCLAFWLEFKDDDEFAGYSFGGIGGGSALKFGIYQRKSDGAWMTGSATQSRVLTITDAIREARQQRDELLAGDEVLRNLDVNDTSDAVCARLQTAMETAAPHLSNAAWAHKYWFLTHPDKLDDFHSPRYQRFHLFKLLQMPPDRIGIRDFTAARFNCAGRFVAAARQLEAPITAFDRVLNQRHGSFHHYWRIGTTAGADGESQWAVMRDGGFVSIGWRTTVPDLSGIIGTEEIREQLREWLTPETDNPSQITRQSGEILNFAQVIAENDIVLACEGQQVLGVGRISGSYEYDGNLRFPHKRPVEWLLHDSWRMPEREGLLTTVHELGRSAENLFELEHRLFNRGQKPTSQGASAKITSISQLAPLDSIAARIENILRRKGQVVVYGPPGTGKTYHALRVARELAARQSFNKTYTNLTNEERAEIEAPTTGYVRICTFHPGYTYEDFIEGLRPRTVNDNLVFEPREGTCKLICQDAEKNSKRNFYLVIDEINRGDVPRIFGELITVIEFDKRGLKITLPSGKPFTVPKNVFLIGTMNTADRSISLLDTALRRRFGFVELMPDSTQLGGRMAGPLPLGAWLDALNARLRHHLKRDARNLQIGHAYLLTQAITSIAEFGRVLRDDVIPLLEEYCYDDFGTLKDILGSALVDTDRGRIREELFEPNREEDLVQALSFPEMQPLVLEQVLTEETTADDEPTSEEAEDAPEPAA